MSMVMGHIDGLRDSPAHPFQIGLMDSLRCRLDLRSEDGFGLEQMESGITLPMTINCGAR
jgi:hypothetical protein